MSEDIHTLSFRTIRTMIRSLLKPAIIVCLTAANVFAADSPCASGPKVYGPPTPIETPQRLIDAITEGKIQLVKQLVRNHADWSNHPTWFSTDPIRAAWEANNLEAVRELLQHGWKANTVGPIPPYITDEPIPALLISRGAEQAPLPPGSMSKEVHTAIERGDIRKLKELKALRSSFGPGSDAMKTAAAANQREIAQFLLDNNYDEQGAVYAAVIEGHCDLATWLASRCKWDPMEQGDRGPLFMLCVYQGCTDLVDQALSKGKVDVHNADSALISAAASGRIDIVDSLHRHGWPIDFHSSYDGSTPLMQAAQQGQLAMVNFLLQSGCDIRAQDQMQLTALYYAGSGNFQIDSPENIVQRRQQILKNKIVIADVLMAKGLSLQDRGYNRFTPLYGSCIIGCADLLEHFILRGGDISQTNDYCGNLMNAAVESGDSDVVDVLRRHGLAISITDSRGSTALHSAARRGFSQIIEALVDRGADVNTRDKSGRTPLDYCTRTEGAVSLLLLGADFSQPVTEVGLRAWLNGEGPALYQALHHH